MNKKKKKSNIVIIEKNQTHDDFSPKKSKSKKMPKTAQETVPFDEVYENGIFRKGETYTLIFNLNNLDYKMMRDDDKDYLYLQYQGLLNALPPEISYQEFIMNTSFNISELTKTLIPPETQHDKYPEIYDDFCKNQQRVINKTIDATCTKILIGAISFERKARLDDPNVLFKHFRELKDNLMKIGIKSATILTPVDALKILHEIYHPFKDEEFLLPSNYLHHDVKLKDYIVPSAFDFRSKDNRAGRFLSLGTSYCRILFVKRFSRTCDDEFIYDILDNTHKIVVSKHIQLIDKEEAMDMLKKQMDDLQGKLDKRREINHKRGTGFIPFALKSREKELTELQNRLSSSDCELFECGFFVYIAAETKSELEDLTVFIKNKARQHQVTLDVLVLQQEKGLNTIMPFATNHFTGDLNDCCYYLPTYEIANFIPFSYNNYFSYSGILYGINQQTNSPIILDRTDEMNGNGFILGTSGSGKSMNTKDEISKVMMKHPNDEILVIDPDREFKPLADKFNGEVVYISPNSNTNINLFDTDISYTDDGASAITMKSDFIMTFIETAKGLPLTANEHSLADRCVKLCYREFLSSNGDKTKLPTLKEYYDVLLAQPDQEAKDLALALELYVTGSFNSFAKHTNIEYKKNFVVFDIFDIGAQLMPVGLQVLLETIWQRVIENKKRGVRTWLWCDEFHIMFVKSDDDKPLRSGAFFETIYKRIRKHGGVATGTTQNITNILESKQATTMLSNAEFVILLQQKKTDLDKIIELFNLSESQYKFLTLGKEGKGMGLIICGDKIIPFDNRMPKDSKMYEICTTDFKEQQKMMQGGG